jgi:recombination protein RecR
MKEIEPLQRLITRLARLPGVGRRSAERMAYRLALDTKGLRRDLASALQEVEDQVCCCSRCGNLTLKSKDPCAICTDDRRERRLLCVVEDPSGIHQLEAAGAYQGVYHCMMGKLSPMQGQDVPPVEVDKLLKRIRDEGVQEVILAFDSDVESDATASYLHEQLTAADIKVSRLAFGIPAGSGIAYSDPVTLARALHGRQNF